ILSCLSIISTSPHEMSDLSLHDALPISWRRSGDEGARGSDAIVPPDVSAPNMEPGAPVPTTARRPLASRIARGLWVLALAYHTRSEEHTSELQSRENLVCRLLLAETKRV